jgi:peptide/nickel transport system permease protein
LIKTKLNISQTIISILLIILFANAINYYRLFNFIYDISFVGKDFSLFGAKTTSFWELAGSLVLLLLSLAYFFFFGTKFKILRKQISLNSFAIISLAIIFTFAPLLVNKNPNFQKDITVRKLKAPLGQTQHVRLNQSNLSADNYGQLSRNVFNNDIHYFTSISRESDTVVIYKGLRKLKFTIDDLILEGDNAAIYSDFHLLGTDQLGRDIYTLLIYAIRISVFVAIASALLASFIGILLGALSGHYKGVVDIIISRISDVFLSIPPIFLILLIIALFGSSIISVILVLGLTGWVSLYRIVKSEYINISENDFVNSSRLLGFKSYKIFFVEILPLMLSPIIVNIVFLIANVILAEAILSFLGLGIGIDHVSLGRMLQIGQEYIGSAWWVIVVPGLTLIVIILSFNNMAEKIKLSLNPLLKHD